MPEIQNLRVKASAVRKDDLLDGVEFPDQFLRSGKTVHTGGHTVETIQRGSTNIVFETTGGRVVVNERADCQVRRVVATDEERAVEKAEFIDQLLQRARDGAAATFASTREKMANTLTAAEDPLVYYSDLESLLMAQSTYKIWVEIEAIRVNSNDGAGCTLKEAVQKKLNKFAHAIFKQGYADDSMRALSRSTGATSNYLADVDREAMMKFISSLHMTGLFAQLDSTTQDW